MQVFFFLSYSSIDLLKKLQAVVPTMAGQEQHSEDEDFESTGIVSSDDAEDQRMMTTPVQTGEEDEEDEAILPH